jgi:hypothetical protein
MFILLSLLLLLNNHITPLSKKINPAMRHILGEPTSVTKFNPRFWSGGNDFNFILFGT